MVLEKRGVLLVFLALIVFLPAVFAEEGCYIYPKASEAFFCVDGLARQEAEADCAGYEDCDIEQHFVPRSCSEFSECELIKCSVDCSFHPKGICEELGLSRGESDDLKGIEITSDMENEWCAPRCCKAGPYCSRELVTKWNCLLGAKRGGVPLVEIQQNFEIDTAACINEWCGVSLEDGIIMGKVTDETGSPLVGVKISLDTGQETLSGNDGSFSYQAVSAGSHIIKATLQGYTVQAQNLQVSGDQEVEVNFVLSPGGAIVVQGTVADEKNLDVGISRATISWSGVSQGVKITDDQGKFEIPDLSPGEYVFTASKAGYVSEDILLTLSDVSLEHNFLLKKSAIQGIRGRTYIDGEEVYGVTILINGVRKSFSRYPDGYEIDLLPGEYQVSAVSGEYSAIAGSVIVEEEQASIQDIHLIKLIPECGLDNFQAVEIFSGEPVLGEKKIRLQWEKPCPEVVNYEITRIHEGEVLGEGLRASSAQFFIIDEDVEWENTYQYQIKAVYSDGKSVEVSSSPIFVGNEECSGKYAEGIAKTFCTVDKPRTEIDESSVVFTCSENRLTLREDCSLLSGGGSYCALTGGVASCKDADICSSFAQKSDPFGLYHERSRCYGSEKPMVSTENFCYFDYTDSVVDQCKSCTVIKSCFDYESRDACQINNCFPGKCEWLDVASNNLLVDYSLLLPILTTKETGRGYCVQEDYEDDDKCSLCGPSGNLFENYYCTSEVCSGLGRCFSENSLSSCRSCGEKPTQEVNCYSYQTELECVGLDTDSDIGGSGGSESDFGFNVIGGALEFSKDQCGWGRCSWQGENSKGGAGSCVKDGDDDGNDDCASFDSNERNLCKQDNQAPLTRIEAGGVISVDRPEITFVGADDHFLGTVHFCLTETGDNAQDYCTIEEFEKNSVEYPGTIAQGSVIVNVLDYLPELADGKTYRLKYFSKDRYDNQEEMHEEFFLVDNSPPEFTISEEHETEDDLTSLTVLLAGESEPMACSFSLEQKLPRGGILKKEAGRDVQGKSVSFDSLLGIHYNLTVACIDDRENSNVKSKWITFDLEQDIEIVSPKLNGLLATTQVGFNVNSKVGATCELRTVVRDEKVADFISDSELKSHQTELLSGFSEGNYFDTYKVVCQELLTNREMEDFFSFAIDFTGPETQIILSEGLRVATPLEYNWEKFFISGTEIDFICQEEGFSCDKTYFCLGSGCEFGNDPRYKEYQETIQLNESSRICYYSIDEAGNRLAPFCGDVRISGFGITLEDPRSYLYEDKVWGVSNQPSFDWIFSTKVPTQECRFDFVEGFSYEETPQFRILTPESIGETVSGSRYKFPQFPKETGSKAYKEKGSVKPIYVSCVDLGGNIGPETELFLEYDPSLPEITDFAVDPETLIEGNKVKLTVETDDKTTCKFSASGHLDYDLMPYSFPGAEESVFGGEDNVLTLSEEHVTEFIVNTEAGQLVRDESIYVVCRNGAGDDSEYRTVNFTVDYTEAGTIATVFPKGDHFAALTVNAFVETTKNARCEYRVNDSLFELDGAGGTSHTTMFSELEERDYQFPLICTMGDQVAEETIEFRIDFTPPTISSVNDGNYTCGREHIFVSVDAGNEVISGYAYEVYNLGWENQSELEITAERSVLDILNATNRRSTRTSASVANGNSITSATGGSMVLSDSVGPELPIKIPTAGLQKDHRYYVKVRAGDKAGNWGEFASSDSIIIVSDNHVQCFNDDSAPTVEISVNETVCTYVPVRLECKDNVGCAEFKVKKQTSSDCDPTPVNSSDSADVSVDKYQSYSGGSITFDESGWICYYAEDYDGNNKTGKKEIAFDDVDGDGINDNCDLCKSTSPGEIVDANGCSPSQVPDSQQGRRRDTDGDGLPDYWEKLYSACGVGHASIDSDGNGILDVDEDYDGDSYTSREEYMARTDPCVGDEPSSGKDLEEQDVIGRETTRDPFAPTPREEETDIVAWVFLILGLLLIFSGTGYLTYYYKSKPSAGRTTGPGASGRSLFGTSPSRPQSTGIPAWKRKLLNLRRGRTEKSRQRRKESLFGSFTKDSQKIPHIENVLQKKKPHLPKLQELSDRYVKHKDKIDPGLRKEEKGIFAKLESIANKSRGKKIDEVSSASEAKDIFAKLRKISKKRKNE